jgi:hypothetical protein
MGACRVFLWVVHSLRYSGLIDGTKKIIPLVLLSHHHHHHHPTTPLFFINHNHTAKHRSGSGDKASAAEVERRVQVRMAQLELKHQEEVRAVKRQYEDRIDRLERALLPPTPPKVPKGAGSKSRGKGGNGLSSSAAALAVAGGPAASSEAAALILSAREMANSKVYFF